MWLVDAFHAILKLAVAFWQFFCDDICPSGKFLASGWTKKDSLTDVELMRRHGRSAHIVLSCQVIIEMNLRQNSTQRRHAAQSYEVMQGRG
jgi:hypothetical protein